MHPPRAMHVAMEFPSGIVFSVHVGGVRLPDGEHPGEGVGETPYFAKSVIGRIREVRNFRI